MGGVELSLTSLKMGAIDKDYFGDGCLASCACGSRSGPLGFLARRTFAACEAVGAGARSTARSAEAVVLLFLGGVIAGGGLALVGGVRRCGECRRHEHRADNAPWILDASSRGLCFAWLGSHPRVKNPGCDSGLAAGLLPVCHCCAGLQAGQCRLAGVSGLRALGLVFLVGPVSSPF